MDKEPSLCQRAHKIVNERSEEGDRQYGPFKESMERAAKIASGFCGRPMYASDIYKVIIALKLSRQSYAHKEDNLLDAIAYLQALHNYEEVI